MLERERKTVISSVLGPEVNHRAAGACKERQMTIEAAVLAAGAILFLALSWQTGACTP